MKHTRAQQIAARRAELAGPAGLTGLLQNLRLVRLALITSLGAFCYGYEQGAYSQVLVMPSFTNNPHFARIASDASYKGWSVSTLPLGGWVGALANGYCCDRFSRRWAIFSGGVVCLVGTGLTAGAQNAAYMFVGRFFIGLAAGSLSAATPLYNSEISAPELRGSLVSWQQFQICCGIAVSYWAGYGTNYISETHSVAWRLPLAFQGVPAILLCVLCLFIPYTPRWLVKQNRTDEALQTLAYLRNRSVDDELVKLEFLEIRAEEIFAVETMHERHPDYKKGGLRMELANFGSLFITRQMFRRTAVACLMQFFQQMSGIDNIVYYAPMIFGDLGLPGKTTSLLASGVNGIIFVLATIPAILLIDRVGRRPLLIAGGLGMAVCLIIISAIIARFESDWPSHGAGGWAVAAFIWLYLANFGFSWGPCSWTVISEVFPLSTRSYGVALAASTNWMMNFVISEISPVMLEDITYGTYLFYLAFMLMGVAYVIWVLPETRGKSLEEMDLAFGSTQAVEEAERMEAIYAKIMGADEKHVERTSTTVEAA
ncbi:hexose transport-related protein [Pterulicium gracile]|uniref:Hexose transport-related protein n=1 Tax=Pterulicium gracile TaxID=1884261 RepID=A0A5C3R316_9AGAR|nr:hexose transport-related protein [Pterula gracilis]